MGYPTDLQHDVHWLQAKDAIGELSRRLDAGVNVVSALRARIETLERAARVDGEPGKFDSWIAASEALTGRVATLERAATVLAQQPGWYEATPFRPPGDSPDVAAAKGRFHERGKREAALGDRIDEDSLARLTEERDDLLTLRDRLLKEVAAKERERDEARASVKKQIDERYDAQGKAAAEWLEMLAEVLKRALEAEAEVETVRKAPRRFTRADLDPMCRAYRRQLATGDDRDAMAAGLRAVGCEVES